MQRNILNILLFPIIYNNYNNYKDNFGIKDKSKTNFDSNNLYLNTNNKIKKDNSINNLNYINNSYNLIEGEVRNSIEMKKFDNKTNKNNYSKRGYNNKKNRKNFIKLNVWTCQNCSNINSNDFLYCKVCKRDKYGKLNRIKNPVNKKLK